MSDHHDHGSDPSTSTPAPRATMLPHSSDSPLRVLLVEDSADDFELMRRTLRQVDPDVAVPRIEDEQTMRAALDRDEWHVILSDFALPGFSGLAALEGPLRAILGFTQALTEDLGDRLNDETGHSCRPSSGAAGGWRS